MLGIVGQRTEHGSDDLYQHFFEDLTMHVSGGHWFPRQKICGGNKMIWRPELEITSTKMYLHYNKGDIHHEVDLCQLYILKFN